MDTENYFKIGTILVIIMRVAYQTGNGIINSATALKMKEYNILSGIQML